MTLLQDPTPRLPDRTGGIQIVSPPRPGKRSFGPAILLVLASAIAMLLLSLLGVVVVMAFSTSGLSGPFTLDNFVDLFRSTSALNALGNTLVYVIVATATSLVVGVPAAWIVERTDLPGKSVVYGVFVIGVLIPGFFTAMGWLFMFHPKSGIINQILVDAFALSGAPFNIVSMPAMGFVQGLSLASVVFAMTCTTFRTMDVALEDAARASGATFLGQLRRVTLPLAWPSILAATLYVAIIAFGAFDVPAIIGLSAREFTFSTFLYFNVNPQAGMPKYGLVAAFSTFMILAGILLSWAYSRVLKRGNRYRVVTGKNYKPTTVGLGRWVWAAWGFLGLYFLVSKVMPLVAVMWTALLPYLQPPSPEALASISLANLTGLPWKLMLDAALNTAIVVIAVPTLAMLYSAILSWVVIRSKYRFRAVYDYVAFIPHAVPTLILGVGALLLALFVVPQQLRLYGSVTLLAIVMSLVMVSFGTRMTNSGLIQIHPELEEAAAVSGAGTFTTLRRVLVPLLRPTLTNGWLWIAILTFRELTVPLILFSPANMTLAVAVWTLWSGGLQGQAAMITVLMLLAVTPLALLYLRLTRNRGGAL